METTERVKFRTFSEEEEKEEEKESRFSWNSKWVSQGSAVPRENADDNGDDDDWKVGAWTSATGVCKIARGNRAEAAAARRQRGLSRDESSFESLDLRAGEVLDRSMQALESSTSLTSCASGMAADYPHWEGGRVGREVERRELDFRIWSRHNWDASQRLNSCRRGGISTAPKTATTPKGCHGCEPDIERVLKDMVNNNTDFGVKVSTTVAKTPEGTVDGISVEDLNVLSIKENKSEQHQLSFSGGGKLWNVPPKERAVDGCQELLSLNVLNIKGNTFEEDQLSNFARGKLWNGPPREMAVEGGQELPSPASQGDVFVKGADRDCAKTCTQKTRDTSSGTAPTLDRLTQTELDGLSGCKMLPPKGKRARDLRLPSRPKGEQFERQINSLASRRRRKRVLKNNDSDQRKLIFPSKPPKWKGLSTALSVMRSICHGAGEAGVVDAQARPLLIIAGKCVFRTTAPLDTPRSCTISHQFNIPMQRASSADEGLPSPRSADISREDTRIPSPQNQPPRKPLLSSLTSFDGPLSSIPSHNNGQSTSSSIKPWPAVVTELDNWISQIINDWLNKDESLATVANTSVSHTAAGSVDSPNLSGTIGAHSRQKLQVSNTKDFPNQPSKSLPQTRDELGKPLTTPSKRLTELDTRIGQAQTVHDLSQLLQPVSQVSMAAILGSKVVGDIKISPMSIIQEFGEDDVVQEFTKQIRTLERENEDLKSSLCKAENSDLFQRLKALHI